MQIQGFFYEDILHCAIGLLFSKASWSNEMTDATSLYTDQNKQFLDLITQ